MPEKKNPTLFREMDQPFNDRKETEAAHAQFFKAVEEARIAAKIPNVYLIVESSFLTSDGGEAEVGGTLALGHVMQRLPMTAWAYGQEKARHEEIIAKLVKGV